MATIDMNDFLSTSQAAKALGITQALVGRYCRQGRIGTFVAGRYLISRDEIKQFRKKPRHRGRPSTRKSA